MDIDDILDALFQTIVEPDPAYQAQIREDLKATQPYYDRLCQALGDQEGDQVWTALASVGATEQDCAFRSGLRLGLRLMALCL